MRADEGAPTTRRPGILCAGIAVLDQVFRLSSFPERDGKTKAVDFVSVVGGGAANAAIAIARLGGVASFAGPLGDRANDPIGDRILAGLTAEGVTCACVGVDGVVSPVSVILVDAEGGRTIIYHRDPALNAARVADPDRLLAGVDGVLADDHCPALATPICAEARRRGLPVVLDVERKAAANDPLLLAATHRIFSRAGLAATTGFDDPAAGLARLGASDGAFLAVTDGAGPIRWRMGETNGEVPAFCVDAVDTLAAGDVYHGAFALGLVETGDPVCALRFAAAAAALKCTRFGGGAAAPARREIERLLTHNARNMSHS